MILFKHIISGPIDADKMDYLLRDSHFSGCQTGVYDLDYLLNNLRIGISEATEEGEMPKISLAINKKALGGLEDFVYSRFHMYVEIYSHKTYAGFKFILREALREVLSVPENAKQLKHAISNLTQFEKFTDAFFWEKFRLYEEANPNSFCSQLLKRKRLKHLSDLEVSAIDDDEVREEQDRLKSKYTHGRVISWTDSAKFSEIKGEFDHLRVRIVDGNKIRLKQVINASSFFKKFGNVIKYHFYLINQKAT